MESQNKNDCIYLFWKNPKTGNKFVVAKLSKDDKYVFEYVDSVKEALKEGFMLLIAFDDINKKYISNNLFPTFSSRVPDKKRKDIKKILNKYGMNEYDEYELLKLSGGRLPIDNLEFIDGKLVKIA